MGQHSSFKVFNFSFGHIGNVRMGIVVFQKNAVSPIWSFVLYCFVELMLLLNIELCIDCLAAFKQFIMIYAFPVPPYTQHGPLRMKVLFCQQSRLFFGVKPFFLLVCDHLLSAMSSKQAS